MGYMRGAQRRRAQLQGLYFPIFLTGQRCINVAFSRHLRNPSFLPPLPFSPSPYSLEINQLILTDTCIRLLFCNYCNQSISNFFSGKNMLGEIAVARYFLRRKLYCYETSLKITCLKLTNYARLSGRIPYQGHSQSDKPSAIFDHSLVRSMHVLSVLLFLFFLQPEKCKPLRIPRVYISKRKQQSKHSRLQMRLHLFFKFTTNN